MRKVKQSSMTEKALRALREAVAQAIEEHRRRGIPVAVWRDGRAVSIPDEEAGALREPHIPYRIKSRGAKS